MKIRFLLIILTISISGCQSSKEKITEGMIKDLLDSSMDFVVSRNIDGILDTYTEDALIKMPIDNSTETMHTLSKENYRVLLESMLKVMDSYEYKIEDLSITINADGQSAYTSHVISDVIEISGEILNSKSLVQSSLVMTGNKLLVSSATLTDIQN